MITNWSGIQLSSSAEGLVRPATGAELQEVLRSSELPIRILGSRLSWPHLLQADRGVFVDLSTMSGMIRQDGRSATFLAGTPLRQAYRELGMLGMRIACAPGVIGEQTVAGAIATGLHGQGLGQSSLSDAVISVRMLDGAGNVHQIFAGQDDFPAAALSLGALGPITEVTFRIEDSDVHICEKAVVTYDEFIDRFEEWNSTYTYTKYWWFPQSREVHAWLARKAPPARMMPVGHEAAGATHSDLNETIHSFLDEMKAATNTSERSQARFRTLTCFLDYANVMGTVEEIFCNGVPAPQVNLEVGVPLSGFRDVQNELASWFANSAWRPHYPVVIRCTGPSTAWLSPAHGRSTIYYGFLSYLGAENNVPVGTYPAFDALQQLLAAAGGRPHWAKYFDPRLFDLRSAYPDWQRFLDLRAKFDPSSRFSNEFLRAILA